MRHLRSVSRSSRPSTSEQNNRGEGARYPEDRVYVSGKGKEFHLPPSEHERRFGRTGPMTASGGGSLGYVPGAGVGKGSHGRFDG